MVGNNPGVSIVGIDGTIGGQTDIGPVVSTENEVGSEEGQSEFEVSNCHGVGNVGTERAGDEISNNEGCANNIRQDEQRRKGTWKVPEGKSQEQGVHQRENAKNTMS